MQPPKDEYELLDFEEADIPLEETWKAMEEVVKQGFAKGIGVSNFNSEQLKRILKVAEIKPVVNEVIYIFFFFYVIFLSPVRKELIIFDLVPPTTRCRRI